MTICHHLYLLLPRSLVLKEVTLHYGVSLTTALQHCPIHINSSPSSALRLLYYFLSKYSSLLCSLQSNTVPIHSFPSPATLCQLIILLKFFKFPSTSSVLSSRGPPLYLVPSILAVTTLPSSRCSLHSGHHHFWHTFVIRPTNISTPSQSKLSYILHCLYLVISLFLRLHQLSSPSIKPHMFLTNPRPSNSLLTDVTTFSPTASTKYSTL
jgi:hypothetical protein